MGFGMEEMEGLCSSDEENMNGKALIRVDKLSKRIMNLDPILVFRESWGIKFGCRWEWWASKIS